MDNSVSFNQSQLFRITGKYKCWFDSTCSPKLLRKPHSLCAASVTSRPNLTAKKGSDCGQIDATTTLCFDASHFCQIKRWAGCHQPIKKAKLHLQSAVWTLLRARTRSTSSRLCWEIFMFSSSDRQPSHDRQALSSNWEPSVAWKKRKNK